MIPRRQFLAFPAAALAQNAPQNAVHRHIDTNIAAHLEKLREYIQQPSISTENRGVRECAEMTRQYLLAAGCREAEIVPTEGHPGVWGWLDAGAAKTLVVYWMYDVQPVNEREWQSPPFEARLVEDKRFGANGRILRGRGATNQKGPERAFLNAVESVRAAAGKLPVNLMFVCEGEEELGSPHLQEVVNRYSARIAKAHGVLMPANSQGMNGSNTVSLGNKGIVYMELEANGSGSGGPVNAEVHGSNKAIADSPSWRLVQALATMTDKSGNRILVEGVTAKVRRPTAAERDVYETFLQYYDETVVKRQLGLERFIDQADKREVLRRTWFEPTLNIDGMWAGYTGPGVKTILPHKANVKIDFRLVPDQSAAEVAKLVRAHLDKHGFPDIKINFWNGYDWSQTDPSSPLVQTVVRTGARHGVQTRVALRNAGSAPMYLFTRNLKLPVVAWGLGHGSGAHSKDEYMLIDGAPPMKGLADAEKGFADFLYAFAGESG